VIKARRADKVSRQLYVDRFHGFRVS
jgi:hypothetical protein